MLTSIPKLASHYSGIGINATVLVDVLSQNKLQLSVEQPRFARINERLEARLNSIDGPDGANWREVFLPEMSEVDSDLRRILEQPIIFELVRGEIREAKISREEPEWSVNFKKALALLFQAKVDTSSWMGEENQINSNNENYWMTKEESIDGLCEVTYQVNEIPKYMIRDRPEYVINHESCPEQKFFSIVKTKNVDNCQRRASFNAYKPGSLKCNGPNCENMWSRTSMTRVIACGTRGNLVIQTIINQGELNQNLLGSKSERFVSGNLQYLRLKEIRSASPKPKPSDLVELKSMMYEYSYKSYQNEQQQQREEQQQERMSRHVAQDPEQLAKTMARSKMTGLKNIPKGKIIEEIKRIMKELVRELQNPIEEDLVEKQITMKVLSVSRGLTMLKKSEIETIFRELKSQVASSPREVDSFKNLFYDTVLMSGSQEAVFFLKEQIQSGEMNTVEILSMLMWMPNSLMFPTEEVLETVFEILKAPKVESCPFTKNTAIMSLTSLVQKACLSKNRDTAYPTWVFGKFCSPESRFVREKFLPYLMNQLESSQSWSKRNEMIVALGMLPHEQVIGKLIPFLEGRIHTQEPVPRMTRLLALWSLATAGEVQPQVVEPIFFAIFSNPAEATEMRISAFNALLKMNPSVAVFHKIVARTWTEEDQEVLKVVNIALATLSQESNRRIEVRPLDVNDLSKKAKMVLPLIKKVEGFYPTSAIIYTSDYLSKLGVGYEGLTSWIASNASFIPVEMYSEITYYLSQYKFRPIAAGIRLQGAEHLWNKAIQILTPLREGQNVEEQEREFSRKVQESLHSEWRKVIEKLNINARHSEDKLSGSFFLNIMESTPIFMNFEHVRNESLIKT